MIDAASDDAVEFGRIRWQCRRGMRELDVLLSRYAEVHYRASSPAERAAFRRLLESQDGVIYGYCLKQEVPPNAEVSALIDRIIAVQDDDP